MFHSKVIRMGEAFQPDQLAFLKYAFQLACDRWNLGAQLTDARRNQLAATILVSAHAGFTDPEKLAAIALDNCRISDGKDGRLIALLNAFQPCGELHT